MTNEERETLNEYIKEVFHYEHQCSAEILARLMLLCELLVEKGIVTEKETENKLSIINVAKIMKETNYGDDTWMEG